MFKYFFQKTPLERAQDHIRQITTASAMNHGGGQSAASNTSSSGKSPAQLAHEQFCAECERNKNNMLNESDAAERRGDFAGADRLYKQAMRYDIDAINDGRRLLGMKPRGYDD